MLRIIENQNTAHLEEVRADLLKLVKELSDESGKFDLIKNTVHTVVTEEKAILKKISEFRQ